MDSKLKFTYELTEVFRSLNDEVLPNFPTTVIGSEYYLLSLLECEDSVGFKCLSKLMLSEDIKALKNYFYDRLSKNANVFGNIKPTFEKTYELAAVESEKIAAKLNTNIINSGILLCAFIKNDAQYDETLQIGGITYGELYDQVADMTKSIAELPSNNTIAKNDTPNETEGSKAILRHSKPQKSQSTTNKNNTLHKAVVSLDKNLVNLNDIAEQGNIDNVVCCDVIYSQLFGLLSKRDYNNVILVGKSGVGKTAIAKNLANMLVNNEVPRPFKDKILAELDYATLVSGTMFKGAMEGKFKPMVNSMKKRGDCIFFVDNIHEIMDGRSNMGEMDIMSLMDMIFTEKNIPMICTATEKGYRLLMDNYPSLKRKLQKIDIDEHTINETITIVNSIKHKYENYHNVSYSDKAVETCVKLCKRYVTEKMLPDSALNIIDIVGAKKSLSNSLDSKLDELEKELLRVQTEKETVKNSTQKKDYDRVDELTKEEIRIKTCINIEEKNFELSKKPQEITEKDIKECMSEKTNIPLNEIGVSDKEKLKDMNSYMKQFIIGQDTAVDEVCKVVKRQRMGLSNQSKPSVFMFVGSSGVGKTLIAKKLAEKVFGSEKYLVRLDMSEYADKTSTNKLIGSAHGYVGYEEGGILTNAIKKKKYCVLLLDEIEKADNEVHNIFLQMFDEGRLTDNRGDTVDFKNVIVIMTSNVGASKVSEMGNGIGFYRDNSIKSTEIIDAELKHKFKPEFLNRIDKIIHFNHLNSDNVKRIIKLEIEKVKEKLNNIDYGLSNDFVSDQYVNKLYEMIKDQSEYGARPVIRIIQSEIEDKITDYLIDNDVETNHIFTPFDLEKQ